MNRETPRASPARHQDNRLSSDDVVKILDLLDGSHSVELKLTVPEKHRGAAIKSLGFDPVEAEPRQTFFFDTPALDLDKAGLIVRARRRPGGKADTVVKLRPVDPATIDKDLLRDPSFKIELDAMPGGYVCSASYKGLCTAKDVADVVEGKARLASLFSGKQRDFYAAHAPAGLKMKDLVALGPTFLLRVKHDPKGFDRPITVELWLYPDGSLVLEISTKGRPQEAFQVATQFRAFLAKSGIVVEKQANSKTSSALKFFSKRMNSQQELAVTT